MFYPCCVYIEPAWPEPLKDLAVLTDKKEKFGWCLYDWANSAFATTVMAAVLPVYFAEVIVPSEGSALTFQGVKSTLSATSLWGYLNGFTALLIVISAPVLGSIADYTQSKKKFLAAFCYAGAISTVLLFCSGPGDIFYTLLLFGIAHYCFSAGNVFYDSFLPFLAKGSDMDRLSSKGYALGYFGGGLLLAANVLFIQFSPEFGVCKNSAIKISIASAGLWWGGFGTIALCLIQEQRLRPVIQTGLVQTTLTGIQRTWNTTRSIIKHRQLSVFLLAYLVYNDGIITVIKMATIYGIDELHLSSGTLLGTLLMVQFVGIFGTILMSRISHWLGAKRTIMGAVLIWLLITLFASRMNSSIEYLFLGLMIAMVLGGTQALSRSYYGRLVPREKSAEFFGYFSVFTKASAILGPILFAIIRQITGTARLSILFLSLFFLTGWGILFFVKER